MAVVNVRFFGPVRRPWPETSRSVEVQEGTPVKELLKSFGFSDREISFLYLSLNGKNAPAFSSLQPGDSLDITLMVGGG